ncbi:MAG TPA: hypothetical protein VEW28_00830 [Candidatus Kapabacteria bacterium]|nr:hypothetical protein [Candidatus Kapabacteria bacterium]
MVLSSCSHSVDPNPVSGTSHKILPMDAPIADTLTIINNTSEPLSVSVTFSDGGGTYGSPANTTVSYPITSGVTAVSVNGVNITEGVSTKVLLPDGTVVYVKWSGNVIVIADTLEVN